MLNCYHIILCTMFCVECGGFFSLYNSTFKNPQEGRVCSNNSHIFLSFCVFVLIAIAVQILLCTIVESLKNTPVRFIEGNV